MATNQVGVTVTLNDAFTSGWNRITSTIRGSVGTMNAAVRTATGAVATSVGGMTSSFLSGSSSISNSSSSIGNIVKKTMDGINGAIKTVFSPVTNLVEHFKWASLAVGTSMLALIKNVVGVAADVEQARVSFDTLLKNPGEADTLMEWLVKFSLQTPFTRSDLQDTARQFLAFGMTLEETKTAVTAVVEATSALGISETKLNSVTYNLAQIYNSTRVRQTEFRELMLQGIPVTKLLAQAVNEGTLKLESYSSAGGTSTSVTKKMTTAYKNASEDISILENKLKKATAGLKEYNEGSKKSEEKTLAHTIAVQTAQQNYDKAKTAISTYNTALTTTHKTTATATKNLTQLNEAQLDSIKEMNSGKDIALALEKQMLKTYGGAAMRQVTTFAGLISNFGDVFQLVVQNAMGISLDGQVKIGGAFDKIRTIFGTLMTTLTSNVDTISKWANNALNSTSSLIGVLAFLGSTFIGFFGGVLLPVLAVAGAIGMLAKKTAEAFPELESFAKGTVTTKDYLNNLNLSQAEYIDLAVKLGAKTKEAKDAFSDANPTVDQATQYFEKMGVKVGDIKDKLPELKTRTKTYGDEVYTVTQRQADWKQMSENLTKALEPLKRMVDDTKTALGFLAVALGASKDENEGWRRIVITVAEVLRGMVWVIQMFILFVGQAILVVRGFVEALLLVYDALNFNKEGIAKHSASLEQIVQAYQNGEQRINKITTSYVQDYMTLEGAVQTTATNVSGSINGMCMSSSSSISKFKLDTNTSFTGLKTETETCVNGMCQSVNTGFTNMATNSAINTANMSTSALTNFAAMGIGVTTANDTMTSDVVTKTDGMSSSAIGKFDFMKSTNIGTSESMINGCSKAIDDNKFKVEQSMNNVKTAIETPMKTAAVNAEGQGKSIISKLVDGIKAGLRSAGKFAAKIMAEWGLSDADIREHGGIINAPIGQPVPIIAHGGERVIPTTGMDVNGGGGSGGVSITFTGAVNMDSESRVNELANKIIKIIGRQNELARYGLG